MNFKYYDLLSSLIVGVLTAVSINIIFNLEFEYDSIPLLAVSYVIGYFINAISGIIEPLYFYIMGGMPSNKLLTLVPNQAYTGYGRIKFYMASRAIELLQEELNDRNAPVMKMFGKAMSYSTSDTNTRVPDFNAQYAFSRVILTDVIILTAIWAVAFYGCIWFWIAAAVLWGISFRRCKERGYYFAKEVLTVYVKTKESER